MLYLVLCRTRLVVTEGMVGSWCVHGGYVVDPWVGSWWVHGGYTGGDTGTQWTVPSVRREPYCRYVVDRTIGTQWTVPLVRSGPYRGGAYRAYQDCDWIRYVV